MKLQDMKLKREEVFYTRRNGLETGVGSKEYAT